MKSVYQSRIFCPCSRLLFSSAIWSVVCKFTRYVDLEIDPNGSTLVLRSRAARDDLGLTLLVRKDVVAMFDLGTRVREDTQPAATFRDDGETPLLQDLGSRLVSWYFQAPS